MRQWIQVHQTLSADSRRLIRVYRSMILKSMADYLTQVRLKAVQEIIPSKNPNNRLGYTRMYRNQPSTPGKLTERTGALIKMLKDVSPWTSRLRSISMSGDAMQGMVKLTSAATSVGETYVGTLSAYIRNENKYQVYQTGGKRTHLTKQQLFFRFKWETGLRGERRQFLEPAARKLKFSTEHLIQARLDSLEKLGAIKFI